MRQRNLSREKALEEYLIYRVRLREFLDMVQIARDIKGRKYEPRDFAGRGPDRFSDTVGHAFTGLFASLMDLHQAALNVFDVWLVLFPGKRDKIKKTWAKIEPLVGLIRDYRNVIVCHANKGLRLYVETVCKFQGKSKEVVTAMQEFGHLAAELRRDEPTALPTLRTEIDPILRAKFPDHSDEQIEGLKSYFLAHTKPLRRTGQRVVSHPKTTRNRSPRAK
jgi:hypothetical protein